MDYKEQIEKEAYNYAYKEKKVELPRNDFNYGREVGFIDAFNSKISERIKVDFTLEVLEELKQKSPFPNYVPHQYINNKITELKKTV